MPQLELLISLIVVIVTVLGLGYGIGRWATKIDGRLKRVEEDVSLLKGAVSILIYLNLDKIIELYKRFFPHMSNPEEVQKEMLLSKLREGTLTPQEAHKLRELLEKQRADALAKGLSGAAIIIGGLLLLLTFLSALSGEKRA